MVQQFICIKSVFDHIMLKYLSGKELKVIFSKSRKHVHEIDAKNIISGLFIFDFKTAKIVANKGFALYIDSFLTTAFHLNHVGYKALHRVILSLHKTTFI